MARPAIIDWSLLRPFPGRAAFAVRLALMCTLVTAVALIYGIPEAAVAAYVVLFMNKQDRTSSITGALALTLAGTVVIGLMFGISQLVLEHAAWRVLAMTALSLVMLWLVSASKLRPVGATLTLVLAFALDLLGSVPAGEVATRGLLYGWLLVGIPGGISVVVNMLLAPAPRELLQASLATQLRTAAAALQGTPGANAQLQTLLQSGLAPCRLWHQKMRTEHTAPSHDVAALGAAIEAVFTLMSAISLASAPGALSVATRRTLKDRLHQMATIFAAGAYPYDIEAISLSLESPDSLGGHVLAAINGALAGFTAGAAAPAPATPATAGTPPAGFLEADAFSNPLHWRYAVKTTGAAMFCYGLYSLMGWPGIHTSMLTCYIVSLGTVGESSEKLSLRLTGCLVGAVLGLAAMLWLIPALTSATAYLSLVFMGALLCAWVAVGSERIAYAGFQMALAFFMCVIQGAGPGFDMVVARDRVIGILLGNVVAYGVATLIWPVGIRQSIESGMDLCMDALERMNQWDTSASARRQLAVRTQITAAAVQVDLERALREPAPLRPSDRWLAEKRSLIARVPGWSALLLAAQFGEGDRAAVSRRLEGLRAHGHVAQRDGSGQNACPANVLAAALLRQMDEPDNFRKDDNPSMERANALV